MRMFVAALVGGALIGIVTAEFLAPELAQRVAGGNPALSSAVVAAFLGTLWGWVAKGVFVKRSD